MPGDVRPWLILRFNHAEDLATTGGGDIWFHDRHRHAVICAASRPGLVVPGRRVAMVRILLQSHQLAKEKTIRVDKTNENTNPTLILSHCRSLTREWNAPTGD